MYAIRSYYDPAAAGRRGTPGTHSPTGWPGGASGRGRVRHCPGRGQHRVITSYSIHYTKLYDVPGVPGIGHKTAAELINEFGDLETLLSRASEIKQNKRRENLIEFAESARVSKQLVQLATDVPLCVKLEDIKLKTPDREKLFDFLEEQGFRSILTRVERLIFEGKEEATSNENTSYNFV